MVSASANLLKKGLADFFCIGITSTPSYWLAMLLMQRYFNKQIQNINM